MHYYSVTVVFYLLAVGPPFDLFMSCGSNDAILLWQHENQNVLEYIVYYNTSFDPETFTEIARVSPRKYGTLRTRGVTEGGGGGGEVGPSLCIQ